MANHKDRSAAKRLPPREEIAARARKIWQERGSPGGRDLEHWIEAERQLINEYRLRTSAPPPGRPESDNREAEKRLDGLIENPPTPARRTPSGENL